MKLSPLNRRGLLDLLVFLPLIAQGVFFVVGLLLLGVGGAIGEWLGGRTGLFLAVGVFVVVAAIVAALCVRNGFLLVSLRVSSANDHKSVLFRYQPLWLAFAYTITFAAIGLSIPPSEHGAVFGRFTLIFGLAHITSTLFPAGLIGFIFTPSPWPLVVPPLVIYAFYGGGMIWAYHKQHFQRLPLSRWLLIGTALLAAFAGLSARAIQMRSEVPISRASYYSREQEYEITEPYAPWAAESKAVVVDNPGSAITEDYPRLDGATATFPVYSAAAQALYRPVGEVDWQDCLAVSKTPNAYERLIAGEVDVIFVGQPSDQQRAEAEAAGRKFILTPVAQDAFVFFVSQENPVTGLTADQIRGIYKRSITQWSALGGAEEKILPYQRPSGSGSQTALEEMVMRGEMPAKAAREEVVGSMGGVLQQVATYKNSDRAIGYSFRYYSTRMNPIEGIKLLAVDGIAPTEENIRSGAYPYTVEFYAVTAGTTNPNAQKFIDWLLSPVGQKLVEDTGYVPLPR